VGIQLTILGSGSSGNCALVESDRTKILVDAGLSCRQIGERLAVLGKNVAALDAILLTHEHSDHARGLKRLCASCQIPVFANKLTAEALVSDTEFGPNGDVSWRIFTTGHAFSVGDFEVEPFSVPHDAQDPVGFVLSHAERRITFLTDLGHATKLVIERARNADVLVLEANHDVKMLQDDCHRPWSLKQRILSRHGHLSNEAAAALAETVTTERLQHIFLAHLSRDCNRPQLARDAVATKLDRLGAQHIALTVAAQDELTPTLSL
jgi:phosphoribosyl 1,2-cyclic phosphodiesterase